jgi:hypothetical protein
MRIETQPPILVVDSEGQRNVDHIRHNAKAMVALKICNQTILYRLISAAKAP